MTLPYETFPSAPELVDGPGVLARLVDSMGFRYRWATEGLGEPDLAFRPVEGAMTLGELRARDELHASLSQPRRLPACAQQQPSRSACGDLAAVLRAANN